MLSQRWFRVPLITLLLLTLGLSVMPTGPVGAEDRSEEKTDPRSVPVKTLDEALKSRRILAESVKAAQADGLAPVMIQLILPSPFQPEGELTEPQVEHQRQAISGAQRSVLKRIDGQKFAEVKQYESIPWMAIHADIETLTLLVAHPDIFRITPDRVKAPHVNTSVPQIGGDVVRQALGNAGAGQTVAIVDTGVDRAHDFLAGKVVSEACYSTSFPLISSNLCPGGSDSTASGSGVPCRISGCDHGTHVAGIAAGNDGNTFGVAPEANIISIQVFSKITGDLLAWDSDVVMGLERVYALRHTHDIAAVNLSLGSGFWTSQATCDDDEGHYKDAIDTLRSAQIATVSSSGNSADNPFRLGIGSPACLSNVISVGATSGAAGSEMPAAWGSQTAPFLDLLAPGTLINSSTSAPDNFDQKTGTSMAAPHATGALAVLRSQDHRGSINDMLNALATTGVSITDTRPAQSITTPRIQLDAAVETFTQRPFPANNVNASPLGGTSIVVTWNNVSGMTPSYTVRAEPPASSLLPARSVTVGFATTAIVGTRTSADGTVLKLRPNTTYTVTVSACSAAGLCGDSQPVTTQTINTLPDAPTNLRATNVTTSSVTLAWDDTGSHPATEFRLVRYVCGVGYDCDHSTPSIPLDGSERSFVIDNLTGNWSVRWRLQACNDDGCNSTWVDGPRIDQPNPGSAPAAPTNLHVCGQGNVPMELCLGDRVMLIWQDHAFNEDRYEFQWSIALAGTPPWNAPWITEILNPNRQSFSFMTWNSGMLYSFQVRACNIYGCSSWSNLVSHTMP